MSISRQPGAGWQLTAAKCPESSCLSDQESSATGRSSSCGGWRRSFMRSPSWPVPAATLAVVTDATQQSIEYAKQAKGGLRGLQTGVAALPVLVSSDVSPDARAAVESRPLKGFAAHTLPAIVDLDARQIHRYNGRIVWGGIYSAWLRERLDVLPDPRGDGGSYREVFGSSRTDRLRTDSTRPAE